MNYQQFRNAQAQMNQRMAAVDPNWGMYGNIGLGATAAVGGVSLLDLVLGSENAFNSGEIPLNTLIALAPVLGAATGSTIGMSTYNPEAAQVAANAQYDRDMKGVKDNLKGRKYESADERVKAQSEFADRRNKAQARRDGTNTNFPNSEIPMGSLRRGRRGAAIGAGAASLPAIIAMLDGGRTEDEI